MIAVLMETNCGLIIRTYQPNCGPRIESNHLTPKNRCLAGEGWGEGGRARPIASFAGGQASPLSPPSPARASSAGHSIDRKVERSGSSSFHGPRPTIHGNAPDSCDRFAHWTAPRSPSCGTPGLSGREFRAQMVNHKPNSILQFSGTPATGFLGRLGGQASSPISCCCNDMLSLDCRLEGAPSVPKSCRKWRFSSRIRAFVHYADLAVFGLELARHCLL